MQKADENPVNTNIRGELQNTIKYEKATTCGHLQEENPPEQQEPPPPPTWMDHGHRVSVWQVKTVLNTKILRLVRRISKSPINENSILIVCG